MIAYRWIALLDILGFRHMLETRSLADVAFLVERLVAAARPRDRELHYAIGRTSKTKNLKLGHLHFSDTILLWTPPLHRKDTELNTQLVLNLCQSVANLIGMALINGLPLRGGLAEGECYIDSKKQIVVGQPVVDAYRLEQEQEWIGAALRSEKRPNIHDFDCFADWLVEYPVPTKKQVTGNQLVAIDWTAFARMPESMTRRFWKMNCRLETEKALFEGTKLAHGTSAHEKWKNTTAFYNVQSKRPSYWVAVKPDSKTGYRIEVPS